MLPDAFVTYVPDRTRRDILAGKLPANLDYVLRTPHLTDADAEAKRAANLASLKRKITYCLNRPSEPLQYQQVESWSARQVLGHMQQSGIPTERIRRSFEIAAF